MKQSGAESKEYADGLGGAGREGVGRTAMLALEGWYESLGRQRGEQESVAMGTGGSGIG